MRYFPQLIIFCLLRISSSHTTTTPQHSVPTPFSLDDCSDIPPSMLSFLNSNERLQVISQSDLDEVFGVDAFPHVSQSAKSEQQNQQEANDVTALKTNTVPHDASPITDDL